MKIEKVDKNYFKKLQNKYKNKGKGLPFVGFCPNIELDNKFFNMATRNVDPSEPLIPAGDTSNSNQAITSDSGITAGSLGEDWPNKNIHAVKWVYKGPTYIIDTYKRQLEKHGEYWTTANSEAAAIRNIKNQIAKKHHYPNYAEIIINRALLQNTAEKDLYADMDYENDMNGDYNFYDPDREGCYKVGDDWVGERTVWEALHKLDRLNESKEDQQRFIDKFGKEAFDSFTKYKQRIKNKGYSNDILYHVKNTTEEEMVDILDSVSDDNREAELDYEQRPIPQDNGNYDIIYKDSDWTVYHPKDYIASIHCANGGRWCTAGGYQIPDGKVKVSQAKEYFDKYTNQGTKLYYYINRQNSNKNVALALHSNGNYEVFNQTDDNITFNKDLKDYNFPNVDCLPELYIDPSKYETYYYDGTEVPDNVKPYIKKVIVKDDITSIRGYAFLDCISLTSVKISDSVISIGKSVFYGCSKLTDIKIPDSVTSIGEYAFLGCTSLPSIKIPDGVTSIGANAFYRCISLTSVTIPDSVISIEYGAFCDCRNIKNVYYKGTKEKADSINIGNLNKKLLDATWHYNSSTNEAMQNRQTHDLTDEIRNVTKDVLKNKEKFSSLDAIEDAIYSRISDILLYYRFVDRDKNEVIDKILQKEMQYVKKVLQKDGK